MGGALTVRSVVGEGTTFEFTLPIPAADHAPEPASDPPPRLTVPPGTRVLLVEDDLVNQQVASMTLQSFGYAVEIAGDGLRALELIEARRPDLVVMDCQLPGLDGYETTRRLRELPSPLCDVPVIAMTASVFAEDRQRCIDAGMDGFLGKPLVVDDLQKALARLLHRSEPREGSDAAGGVVV